MMTDPAAVSVSQNADGTVATVVLSNPNKLNSVNTNLLDAFVTTMSSLARSPHLRCIIVTGGRCTGSQQAFVGGADMSEMKAFPNAAAARTFITKLHLACKAIRDMPLPVIARVNGHALGGGMILMASADLRIATSEALFGMPEVQRGVPSTVDSAMLPAQIGSSRARRLLLLGDMISAEQAESWGLIDKVVQPHELDKAVDEWIQLLVSAGPRALAAQKRLLKIWGQVPLQAAIDAGVWEFGRAFEDDALDSEGRRMMNDFELENKKRKRRGKL